jgi:hypothetical protein
MIGTADVYKAVNAAWDASGLDAVFTALWSGAIAGDYEVLCDQEASPGQPYPYCVMDRVDGMTVNRMSSLESGKQRHVRRVAVKFNVQAADVVGDVRSSKEIANYLAEEIMKVFGGHPTVAATASLSLDNGNHLITQYQNDYGVRQDDDKWQWTVEYSMFVDVPVKV